MKAKNYNKPCKIIFKDGKIKVLHHTDNYNYHESILAMTEHEVKDYIINLMTLYTNVKSVVINGTEILK